MPFIHPAQTYVRYPSDNLCLRVSVLMSPASMVRYEGQIEALNLNPILGLCHRPEGHLELKAVALRSQ